MADNTRELIPKDVTIVDRVAKAQAEISALCNGKHWTMCIPAQWDDSDILLADVIHDLAQENKNLRMNLDVALKWLDKIASFAGKRQRSATETEDFYLKGVHDADMATRKLVEMAKEEIERIEKGK